MTLGTFIISTIILIGIVIFVRIFWLELVILWYILKTLFYITVFSFVSTIFYMVYTGNDREGWNLCFTFFFIGYLSIFIVICCIVSDIFSFLGHSIRNLFGKP